MSAAPALLRSLLVTKLPRVGRLISSAVVTLLSIKLHKMGAVLGCVCVFTLWGQTCTDSVTAGSVSYDANMMRFV